MNKKIVFGILAILVILGSVNVMSAQLNVGVKAGDWITYSVSFTGTPDPSHAISSSNMTVLSVQGTQINVTIDSTYQNGTKITTDSTLNLQTGQLIDNFIIPANLAMGDIFYSSYYGNVTITGQEQKSYAGATRTVLNATLDNNTYIWDQQTGVSLEGISDQPTYTMHSLINQTNMWQAQIPEFGITATVAFATAAIFTILTATTVLTRKRKP